MLRPVRSSAGNTRGLIEAYIISKPTATSSVGLPRGIPAASLKVIDGVRVVQVVPVVFRGEYPRPH